MTNDYDDLKTRIETVVGECESLMEFFHSHLTVSQKGKLAQLKEIEKTIANMQNKGLTIPSELRRLKLDLLSEIDAAEKHSALKNELIENIHRIFSVRFEKRKKRTTSQSPQKTKTKLVKHFPPNGTLCRFIYKNQAYNGEIRDRQLVVDGYGGFSSFSAASVKITQTSRNGWRDWELQVPGSKRWILADGWREINR